MNQSSTKYLYVHSLIDWVGLICGDVYVRERASEGAAIKRDGSHCPGHLRKEESVTYSVFLVLYKNGKSVLFR